jgi:hypothetical protein
MIRRDLKIGRWDVEFYFAEHEYDSDMLLDRLFDLAAPIDVMREAMELMDMDAPNTGFTFVNPYDRCALVAIGPTTDGSEFIDTLTHEIYHVAVAIADGLGVDLEGETPAYISGDSMRALADTVCQFGCKHCN